MNRIARISLLLAVSGIAIIIACAGCTKTSTHNMLVGRWSMINIPNITDTTFVLEWEFKGSGELIIYRTGQGPNDSEFSRGSYKVKSYNKFVIFDEGVEGFDPWYPGTWQIVQRKKGTLRIVRDIGGLLSYEFIRV
jgi:hypothetical protein